MVELGYALSSEEHRSNALIRNAAQAEQAGFTFALVSDHFHPWVDNQGQSPFVWSVLGGIAHATSTLRVGTGVTCPTIRIHPAIIAQAAATCGDLFDGRFFLGVGTGEALNEHITGQRWPSADERRAMLQESLEVMRLLWRGGNRSHRGHYFHVEDARIYTLPESPVEIMVAASGPAAAKLAGAHGDGLISTAPDAKLVQAFADAGGAAKPRYGQFTCCWAASDAEARATALHYWPNAAVGGELGQELPLPRHFEQASEAVTEDDIAEAVVCGPDPQPYLDRIREFADAGFDHVYLHQVGPDQEGFFEFAKREILPRILS